MPQARQTSYFVHQLLRARDWQHRPQLDEVCKWWRGGGRGVLALVGMGGAGKTAIAERFLRVLPGGLPEDPDIAKDATLRPPDSVFVFSFYDAPNPEAFFEAVQMWLEDSPHVENALSLQQLYFKLQNTSGLLMLDGLEKVQEDGVRGLLGRLSSAKLREFLDRIAAGYFSAISVLVTSRFPLADLRDARPQFFRLVPIDEIEQSAGIELLRARGVRGTDAQLASIVEACGQHALTVDFAGGYISEFGGGDPATHFDFKLGSTELLRRLEDEPDEARRHVLKQGHRFARLAERYRDAMLGNTSTGSEGDAGALALLQRICLFRLGVDAETLADIFTGEKAIKASGAALAALNHSQLQKKLDWLVRMRIVESQSEISNSKSELRYSIHPAVRDGFLSGLGDAALRENHEAVRQGLQVSLGDSPGRNPSDSAVLDLLEEIIFHSLQSGHVREGWGIYRNRIGGYQNLGWRLGAYERGMRICRAFEQPFGPKNSKVEKLADVDQAFWAYHYALFKMACGSHEEAQFLLNVASKIFLETESFTGASRSCRMNAEICLRLGAIQRAVCFSEEATKYASVAMSAKAECDSLANQAAVSSFRGDVVGAFQYFQRASETEERVNIKPNQSKIGITSLARAALLAKIGRLDESEKLLDEIIHQSRERFGEENQQLPRCWLQKADISMLRTDLVTARQLTQGAHEWAIAHDAKELLCWSALVQARVELAKRQRHAAVENRENGESSVALPVPSVSSCSNALRHGLQIARDCGFGLFHIDLLLTRARLHLLCGDPEAALDDLRTALDDGVPASEQTGQPELLAAAHPECGYAWAIAEGLQLRGEALLLQAAQLLDFKYVEPCLQCGRQRDERALDRAVCHYCSSFKNKVGDLAVAIENAGDSPDRIRQWGQIRHWLRESFGQDRADSDLWSRCKDWLKAKHKFVPEEYLQFSLDGFIQLLETRQPTREQESLRGIEASLNVKVELLHQSRVLVSQAKELLNQALEKWQPLHDPEPERLDQNFQLHGKPYNYRAAETHRILTALADGVLTNYPLSNLQKTETPTPKLSSPTMSDAAAPCVFISYSHDSDDHRARVLGLSERLRADGIETILDRYVPKGSPAEGWPRWMLNGLDKATHVLCICTETYYRRFRGQEVPGKGKGVDWEGALMTQSLYDARSVSNKFIPVLFSRSDDRFVPEPLRAQTFYALETDESYEALYDALLDQSGVEPGPVGTLKRKPRATGEPITFNDTPTTATNRTAAVTSSAVTIWREKLDYLLVQDAVTVDPDMKFRLKHLIDEARRKIRDLDGGVNE